MITTTHRRLSVAYSLSLILLALLPAAGSYAQDSLSTRQTSAATSTSFSLKEAIDYALKNNINVTNSQLDARSAEARVGEIRAIGLPQVSAEAQAIRNIKIQSQFVPAGAFMAPDTTAPSAPPSDAVLPLAFGVNYMGIATITATQLIFDGSYLIGLKAAKTYKELAQKNLNQSKVNVTEAVTKAYYSVLVNQERMELLRYNVNRLDTLLLQTQAQFENGFVEKIDVDRIEVQYNNLKVDLQRTERLVELTKHLLKFQMGYQVKSPIELTDKLAVQNIEALPVEQITISNYSQRPEYATLETQQKLAELDIRNNRAGYFPRLAAFGNFGYNNGSMKFDIHKTPWYNFSSVGLSLSLSIFDGLQKHYKIQQAKLTHEKTTRSLTFLQNSIDLEVEQANVNLSNSLDALKTQRRNLELAQRVAQVTKIKYEQGVGSNIEVVNAEGSLREAQTNYYSALYDALISKVDADRAVGKLATE